MATYTESFNKADGALGPDLAWATDVTSTAVVAGQQFAQAVLNFGAYGRVEQDIEADMAVQFEVSTLVLGPDTVNDYWEFGAMLRMDGLNADPGNDNQHYLDVWYNADTMTSPEWGLYPQGDPLEFLANGPVVVAGDVIRLEAVGDQLRALLNGVEVLSTTLVAAPFPGVRGGCYVWCSPDSDLRLDNFLVMGLGLFQLLPDVRPQGTGLTALSFDYKNLSLR